MCPGVFSVPQPDPSSVPGVSRGRLERDREGPRARLVPGFGVAPKVIGRRGVGPMHRDRSEEHTSELQSRLHLVCRLLLEKKKEIKLQLVSEDGPCVTTPHGVYHLS